MIKKFSLCPNKLVLITCKLYKQNCINYNIVIVKIKVTRAIDVRNSNHVQPFKLVENMTHVGAHRVS